jgi:lipopolysaccharide assembly outer membrane protein LptD (OstA)
MGECGKLISKLLKFGSVSTLFLIVFVFLIMNKGFAQTDSAYKVNTTIPEKDSNNLILQKTLHTDSLGRDTIVNKDSSGVKTDTSKKKRLETELGIKISKDALPSVVTAVSDDSAVLDMHKNLFYLYGKAQVNYEDIQLNASRVAFNQATSIIEATPGVKLPDTVKKKATDTAADRQTFTQGSEKFTFDSMQYNFKSKRAIVVNAKSQYGEGFVHSEMVKRSPDQSIYGWHSVYTTCALDTPHFGILAKKIKVIPGKIIVSGPAVLSIEGIQTPLWLPFGLFPITDKQKSGFIIPTYSVEQARGLGLLNGGYYLYLNDHVDFKTQANFYTKGSYSLSGLSTYSNIYHYSGGVNFSYAYNKTGEDFEPGASITKDFMLNWHHQSDPKSVPGQSFSASVTAGTSSFYSNNSYDPNQILQNQYSSNISYSKSWQGTPFSLTASALHSQNTQTKQINVTLPAINFHVNQLNPFQTKKSIGTHWYQKITLSYSADELNKTTFYDSTLNLAKLSLSSFQTGIHHSVPISASYTVLRYINMSFNINYNEYWVTQQLKVGFDSALNKIDTDNRYGFFSARDFNAGLSLSTRIYGMKLFENGRLKGIRHLITPNMAFNYHPDFGASPFNYYYQARLDTSHTLYTLSPFQTSVVGMPPQGKSGTVSFGLNNNLQIKVKTSKDTASGTKNITLIDALGANISYNPAVDSYQWSNISVNFRTNILDKINISSSGGFDPYKFDYNYGRRISQTMLDAGTGIARFTGAQLSLGSNFHSKPAGTAPSPTANEEYSRLLRNAGYFDYAPTDIPWSFNFSYSMQVSHYYTATTKTDTTVYNQTVTFQGETQLTKRWKLNVNSGYNFTTKELTLTSIDISRDLHCWVMHLQALPFGPRKSFNFTLNVKSAILQDLKIQRRRDYRDAPY